MDVRNLDLRDNNLRNDKTDLDNWRAWDRFSLDNEISEYCNYVGTSLGYCISDILKGKIDLNNVVGMETHTSIKDEEGLINALEIYCIYQWELVKKPDILKAVKIAYTLFFNKPFFQSRLTGGYSVSDSQKKIWMFVHTTSEPYSIPYKPRYVEKTINRKAKRTTKEIMKRLKEQEIR